MNMTPFGRCEGEREKWRVDGEEGEPLREVRGMGKRRVKAINTRMTESTMRATGRFGKGSAL